MGDAVHWWLSPLHPPHCVRAHARTHYGRRCAASSTVASDYFSFLFSENTASRKKTAVRPRHEWKESDAIASKLGFASITNERPRKSPIGSFVIAAMLGALEVPTHASGPQRANNCAGAPTGPGGPRAFSWPRWVDVPGAGCQCLWTGPLLSWTGTLAPPVATCNRRSVRLKGPAQPGKLRANSETNTDREWQAGPRVLLEYKLTGRPAHDGLAQVDYSGRRSGALLRG